MNNPYQSSTTNPVSSDTNTTGLNATERSIYHLASAKGWVRFVSVLIFIFFAFSLLGVLGGLAAVANAGALGGVILIITITYAMLSLFLGLKLSGFASAISRLIISRNPIDLEQAMVQQMKFWRLSGILVLIFMVLAIIGLISPSAIQIMSR